MTRSSAREVLMQLLFQMEIQQDFSDELKEKYLEELPGLGDQKEYVDGMFAIVRDNISAIDSKIEEASDNWKMNRISKVDLSILRLAAAEIIFAREIPREVSINEAVELAKKFGTGGKFVNGVLSKIENENN